MSLLEKIEATINNIESTKKYWETEEIKKEGEELLMWAWEDLDRCVEGYGQIDHARLERATLTFMSKVVG